MKIENNKVVAFHYRMYEGDELLETSSGASRMLYLHGHGGVLPALEQELEGRAAGDRVDVTLDPDRAYGRRRELPLQRVPLKRLAGGRRPAVGDMVRINTDQGVLEAVVRKIGRFNVDVDVNHPLAGKTLRFEIDVEQVRDATDEEIDHGHAHAYEHGREHGHAHDHADDPA